MGDPPRSRSAHRDRVPHHAILNVIDPLLRRSFIADTYACIPVAARTHLRAIRQFLDVRLHLDLNPRRR